MFATSRSLSVLSFALIVASCATTENLDAENRRPVANAGEDVSVALGESVLLDGSRSSDPDDDELIYRWDLMSPEGSAASLTSTNFVETEFEPDVAGTYIARLVVSDGEVDSPPDTVTIDVSGESGNAPPTASIAGAPELSAIVGMQLTLDASASSDPDGDPLSFEWSLDDRPSGSTIDLLSAGGDEARLTPDVEGRYEVSLIVRDGVLASEAVTVFIDATEESNTPMAVVGNDRSITVGAEVTLDGSGSIGSNLTFAWSIVRAPNGSSATLGDASQAMATLTPDAEGEFEVRLVVTSAGVDSAPASVVLTATADTTNQPPVADAGADLSGQTDSIVTLDGSNSSDPEGSSITYTWRIASTPTGSATFLDDTAIAMPSFIPDRIGSYTFELSVDDGDLSSTDSVTVSITGGQPSLEGEVVITEFLADAADDGTEEWFELHNPSMQMEWDLQGCVIEDNVGTHTIATSLVVAPGDYVTLAKSSSPGFTPAYDYMGDLAFANGGDLIIVTCGSNEIANLVFDSSFTITEAITLQLVSSAFDEVSNDSASNWCEGTATYGAGTGTPGGPPDCS